MDADPQAWLELINGASLVVTNTFHGTVFSMRLHKKFVLELNPSIQDKTIGTVEAAGLQERVFNKDADFSKIAENEIDFSMADQFSRRESTVAEEWLKESLRKS